MQHATIRYTDNGSLTVPAHRVADAVRAIEGAGHIVFSVIYF